MGGAARLRLSRPLPAPAQCLLCRLQVILPQPLALPSSTAARSPPAVLLLVYCSPDRSRTVSTGFSQRSVAAPEPSRALPSSSAPRSPPVVLLLVYCSPDRSRTVSTGFPQRSVAAPEPASRPR